MILFFAACSAPDLLPEAALERALQPTAEVERDRLEAHLLALVQAHATEEPSDRWEMPHTHLLSADYVEQAFEDLGYEPVREEMDRDGLHTVNVYAELPGASDEIVLVTAHHDAWYVGADDNSSGVSGMLEVARVLRGEGLGRTVRFVAFDQEETSLGGSRRHFERHAGEPIVGIVNLESIGFALHSPGSQQAPTGFAIPDVADFIAVIGNDRAADHVVWAAQLAGRIPDPVPVQGAIGAGDNDWTATGDFHRSDHSPAWLAGLPAVMFTDTTEFRNDAYHTPDDTPETIDWAFLTSVTQLAAATTTALAEAP